MTVYMLCDGEREEFFRDILEKDFELREYDPDAPSKPAGGDVVLADLAQSGVGWRDQAEELRRSLGEGARLVAVLRFEQIRRLDHRVPIDDFISDGSTGAEIKARLRRQASGEAKEAVCVPGALEIDPDRYEVRMGGAPVELTYKEFELLRFLASRPGKVFTREVLLEQVWGYDYFGGSRTVDVHIRRIRSKIEREGRTYIRTVRGVGYIFEP